MMAMRKQTSCAKASSFALLATEDKPVVGQRAKAGMKLPAKKGAWKGNGSFPLRNGSSSRILGKQVLSNQNMVDYPTVQPDKCPDRTARPERPFPDGPATARLK